MIELSGGRYVGQASSRGTPEERRAQAIAAQRDRFPATVKCNNCQADLAAIEPVDVRGIPGMRLAGQARCPSCDHVTWVLEGTQSGLELFQSFLDEHHGGGAVGASEVKR
ncbi:MAG: hypothetical protein ABIQ32_12745 [Sphingomicrobium sp.]